MPCLRELDVLEVEGAALVRLDALETAEVAALGVGGLRQEDGRSHGTMVIGHELRYVTTQI